MASANRGSQGGGFECEQAGIEVQLFLPDRRTLHYTVLPLPDQTVTYMKKQIVERHLPSKDYRMYRLLIETPQAMLSGGNANFKEMVDTHFVADYKNDISCASYLHLLPKQD